MGPKIVKSFPKWTMIIVYGKILLFIDEELEILSLRPIGTLYENLKDYR